jgi:Ca2+/Na+ antiporter
MRILSAIAALLVGLVTAAPAHTFEYKQTLKQVFGTSDLSELGGPIFALIVVAAILFFWGALKIGKRRQRRMIESYDDQLQDYASRLRRGKL